MRTRAAFLAGLLALMPLGAIAQESAACEEAHANCQEGTVYDAETKTCVVVSS